MSVLRKQCLSGVNRTTQWTWDIDQMLGQCWPAVYDVGPTLAQHRVNVSCSRGADTVSFISNERDKSNQEASGCSCHQLSNTALQIQTTVTAYLKSKQLLLFAFVKPNTSNCLFETWTATAFCILITEDTIAPVSCWLLHEEFVWHSMWKMKSLVSRLRIEQWAVFYIWCHRDDACFTFNGKHDSNLRDLPVYSCGHKYIFCEHSKRKWLNRLYNRLVSY